MASRYYLYGIFPAPGPTDLEIEGLDKQAVRSHQLDDFTFLFSDACQNRYLASRKNLLGHERVLEAAMQHGYHTLLPLQFGLTIEDWQQVQQDLVDPHKLGLSHLFQRLQGRREVSIKIMWDATLELELLMQDNQELRHQRDQLEGTQLSMDQVIAIGQQIEAAMEDRKQAIVNEFRQVLNPLAKDVIENDPITDTMIFNAAYLIDWGNETTFSQAIETVDSQFGDRLRIRYNNFTAPYNFAQLNQLD